MSQAPVKAGAVSASKTTRGAKHSLPAISADTGDICQVGSSYSLGMASRLG
jgi:hypothetical protein